MTTSVGMTADVSMVMAGPMRIYLIMDAVVMRMRLMMVRHDDSPVRHQAAMIGVPSADGTSNRESPGSWPVPMPGLDSGDVAMQGRSETWTIGDIELTAVVEAETAGIPLGLFYPDGTPQDLQAAGDWLTAGMADPLGTIAFRVQAFVLRHRGRLIVVDPCVGNGKQLTLPFWNELDLPWLHDFRSAGFDPSAVDLVVHTHLHEDHIGWDTHWVDGVWTPTFPNARHVYVGNELDWAATEERRQGQDPFAQSIAPIVDAGLAWEVSADTDLGDGLRLVSTPGHTPGHASLEVETGGPALVISGDLLHHPFQLARPRVSEVADIDRPLAVRTRSDFFTHHSKAATVVAGTHFPIAPLGRIEPSAGAWRWTPVATGLVS